MQEYSVQISAQLLLAAEVSLNLIRLALLSDWLAQMSEPSSMAHKEDRFGWYADSVMIYGFLFIYQVLSQILCAQIK